MCRQLLSLLHLILEPRDYTDLQMEMEAADKDAMQQLPWAGGQSALPTACFLVDLLLELIWTAACSSDHHGSLDAPDRD